MDTTTTRRRIRSALIAGLLAATVAATAAAADAGTPGDAWRPLAETVAKMPAGWPATDAMRAAARRLGDAADHAEWRRAAGLLPAGWPAADVMRRAAG